MVIIGSHGIQFLDGGNILVVVGCALIREGSRIIRVIRGIGIGNLGLLHIDFDDGKASDQPGVDAIDADIGNCLVFCCRLTIKSRDIGDVSLRIHQINV